MNELQHFEEDLAFISAGLPGLQIDPRRGPHNRTLNPDAIWQFDKKNNQFVFRNDSHIPGDPEATRPSDEWWATQVEGRWIELVDKRIEACVMWDEAIGIPLGVLWDPKHSLPEGTSELEREMTADQLDLLWERLITEPTYAERTSRGEVLATVEQDREQKQKERAKALATSPFEVSGILSAPELEWLFGEQNKKGWSRRMSFLCKRENTQHGMDKFWPTWREHLVFPRVMVSGRPSNNIPEWQTETIECGHRSDGSKVWLHNDDCEAMTVAKRMIADGVNVLGLRAQKGIGKTQFTKRLVAEFDAHVRAVIHLRSLARNLSKELEVPCYLNDEFDFSEETDMVITYHSLSKTAFHKLSEARANGEFTILFLDEVLSGFLVAFGSDDSPTDGIIRDREALWEVLQDNIGIADLVIAADADLHPFVLDVIAEMKDASRQEFQKDADANGPHPFLLKPAKVGVLTVADRIPKSSVRYQVFSRKEDPVRAYVEQAIRTGQTLLVLTDSKVESAELRKFAIKFCKEHQGQFLDPYAARNLGAIPGVMEDPDGDLQARFILINSATVNRSENQALLTHPNPWIRERQPQIIFASNCVESGLSYTDEHFEEVVVAVYNSHMTAQRVSQQSARARKVQKLTWFIRSRTNHHRGVSSSGYLYEIANRLSLKLGLQEHLNEVDTPTAHSFGSALSEGVVASALRRKYLKKTKTLMGVTYDVSEPNVGTFAYAASRADTLVRIQRDRFEEALQEQWRWEAQPVIQSKIVSEEDAKAAFDGAEAMSDEKVRRILQLVQSGEVGVLTDSEFPEHVIRSDRTCTMDLEEEIQYHAQTVSYYQAKYRVHEMTAELVKVFIGNELNEILRQRNRFIGLVGNASTEAFTRDLRLLETLVPETDRGKAMEVALNNRLQTHEKALKHIWTQQFDESCLTDFCEMVFAAEESFSGIAAREKRRCEAARRSWDPSDQPAVRKHARTLLNCLFNLDVQWKEERKVKGRPVVLIAKAKTFWLPQLLSSAIS